MSKLHGGNGNPFSFLMSKENFFNKLKRNVKEKNQTWLPKQDNPQNDQIC